MYCVESGSCEGGALPVIMSINGPRETHDDREFTSLSAGPNLIQDEKTEKELQYVFSDCRWSDYLSL